MWWSIRTIPEREREGDAGDLVGLAGHPGQFTAVAYDQFGNSLAAPAGVQLDGDGRRDDQFNGALYGGQHAGRAVYGDGDGGGSFRDGAVTVSADIPSVVNPAHAVPNPVNSGTTTNLSVLGGDAAVSRVGMAYQWSVTGPAGVP